MMRMRHASFTFSRYSSITFSLLLVFLHLLLYYELLCCNLDSYFFTVVVVVGIVAKHTFFPVTYIHDDD